MWCPGFGDGLRVEASNVFDGVLVVGGRGRRQR